MEIIDKEYDFSNLGQTPKIKYFYGDEDLKKFVEDTAKLVYDRIVCINHKR